VFEIRRRSPFDFQVVQTCFVKKLTIFFGQYWVNFRGLIEISSKPAPGAAVMSPQVLSTTSVEEASMSLPWVEYEPGQICHSWFLSKMCALSESVGARKGL